MATKIKQAKFELTVAKESFLNEKKETIFYYSYNVNIGGESFRLKANPDDKRFLNHLLDNIFDSDGFEDNGLPL